jgi:hypothetical protein
MFLLEHHQLDKLGNVANLNQIGTLRLAHVIRGRRDSKSSCHRALQSFAIMLRQARLCQDGSWAFNPNLPLVWRERLRDAT